MPAITSGEIRIETLVPIEDLQELSMEIKQGSHAVVSLTGFLAEEDGETALFHLWENAELKVWTGNRLLFRGLVREIQVTHEGRGYQISIQGISSTIQIDYKKKNRTFQNCSSTYQEIIRKVLGDTDGANLNFYADDRKTGTPFYQIEETDWEFIRRLASQLKVPIIPSVLSDKPEIYVGLPTGRIHQQDALEAYGENVWFDKEKMGFCRIIRTYEDLEIGDQVKWEGVHCTITDKSCRLDKGLLVFQYRMMEKALFSVKAYENQKTIGRLLPARVLDAKNEQVKVKFDIDMKQSVEEAYWYPWEPDAGNIMYCMPEKGERIYIYLGDCFNRQAKAVCGVHTNGRGNPEMRTTDRYFTTMNNKRMYLLPDKMGFQDLKQGNPLEMSLTDENGTDFVSNRQIIISARETIGIKGNNLFFQAPKEISLVKRDNVFPTVINMCNGFDSIGSTNEVTMAGAGNEGFPVFREYQQEKGQEYSIDGIEKEVIASTPGQTLTSGLEKQIRGIRVDQIGTEGADNRLAYGG